jgi:hypothetical protein
MTTDGKPDEETEMPLYGGIDLHANNSVVVLLNDQLFPLIAIDPLLTCL